jgi:hypothetical protein
MQGNRWLRTERFSVVAGGKKFEVRREKLPQRLDGMQIDTNPLTNVN